MAKVEVQVRSCFCCPLSVGSVFIALYTLLLYALLTGLAAWALTNRNWHDDNQLYKSCDLEAQGQINADNRKITFHAGSTIVIVEDSTTYHCSFGLYTEELKFSRSIRYSAEVFDIFLYALLILASLLLLAGIAFYSEWLLIPWIVLMAVDIVRGFISTIFIFIYSYGNLARLATAIFFLGLQFFHVSMIVIIIAKFQRIHNRKKGIPVDGRPYDPRYGSPYIPPPSSYGYPPSQHGTPLQPAYQGGYPVDYPPPHQQPYAHQRY